MASILQMLTSSLEAGKNAASSVANHAKASNAKQQDASLFSIVMGGCVPSKSKQKSQPRELPSPTERGASVETKRSADTSDAGESGDSTSQNTDAATTTSDQDSRSDTNQQQDAHGEAADQALDHQEAATDSLRDGDIVDVPEGYADEALSDPTKDPLNEAIALGLLAGQAVPVNQLPQAAASFAVAVDAALVAPANAKSSPLIAQPLSPSIDAVEPESMLPVVVEAQVPAPVADAALTALITASLMDQDTQAVTANKPEVTHTQAIILPADMVAPETTAQEDAAIAQALEALAQQAAPVETKPGVSSSVPQPAPIVPQVAADTADAVKAASVPAETLAQAVSKTDEAADDTKPVTADVDAVVATAAPTRLGKVAPAALKALVGQVDADAQAKPAPEQHAQKQPAPEAKEHMAALGSNPAAAVRAQAEPAKVVAAPVVAIEVASVTAQNTGGNTSVDGGASGIASVGGSGFAATLQNAVQLPGSQSIVRGGVAEQIAAQIATLPKNKGTQFTLKLNPEEMGAVDVVMDFHKDGHVQLTIRADNEEALATLRRDAQALERNLQDLGLKTDSGSLQFSLRQDQQGGQAASQFGDAQQHGRGQSSGQPHVGRGSQNEEETIPLAQVNYRIMRADGSVDIQV